MKPVAGPQRELALIQLWETLSTVAKAAFFFVVTPVLLARLGREEYGWLALSFSVVTCVVVTDFGIRGYLRVTLSAMSGGEDRFREQAISQSAAAFLCVQLPLIALTIFAGHAGWWSRWLGLGPGGDVVLVAAVVGSSVLSLSLLLVEPLAARRQLSPVKLASFLGNVLAVPLVFALASTGASALGCALGYLAALTLPNLVIAAFLEPRVFAALLRAPLYLHPHRVTPLLLKGGWFALFAALWLLRSYLITFLISAIFGPAEAGMFFILLKLSELLSVFGANASETAIADLSANEPVAERRGRFLASYRASLAASVAAFAGLACLTPIVIEHWFRLDSPGVAIGVFVGCFGLAGGFNRAVATACMGLGLTRSVALWGFLETSIVLGGAVALRSWLGLASAFAAGIVAALALIAPARKIARALEESGARLWVQPAGWFFAGIVSSAACAIIANSVGGWARWGWAALGCACGGAVGAHYLRQLHGKSS